ncbi:MAG: hypothetical protein K5665_09030 [Saccharofermentans sp.]|nr:hypothetical protein [Saccharofermentans sp.]
MFRKVITVVIVAFFSLILFAGCSSSGKGKDKPYDARSFVDECRILMPASKYKDADPVECATYFTKAVFEQFGKSDYYKNMSDLQRETAVTDICKVLQKYEYCNIEGFITGYDVDMSRHEVTWYINGLPDAVNVWIMPGY